MNSEFIVLMKVTSESIILVVQMDSTNPMNQIVPYN
jgi:hypothetical protein